MSDRGTAFAALLRSRLSAFIQKTFGEIDPATPYAHNWHIDHVCHKLTQVAEGDVRRLIINVPPRSMKSIMCTVAFPAWMMGRDPSKRFICVSYGDDPARKFAIDSLNVVNSAWYRELFPHFRLTSSRPSATEYTTTERGYRLACGIGGAVHGRGADVIVIDDPIKPLDALSEAGRRRVMEAYDNVLYPRLNNKGVGAIVIVMQRLHESDLVGHLLGKEEWDVVSLPAIATEEQRCQLSGDPEHVYIRQPGEILHPEREPADVLEAIRRTQGSLLFSAQYQQQPVPAAGNVIKRDWLRHYESRPHRFDRIVASWDTASTLSEASDWSAGTVWGSIGLDYYLLDVVRDRYEAPELRRRILELTHRWHADATLIEDTELGRALAQDLHHRGELRPILYRPRHDKLARLLAQAARFEAGQVRLPAEAHWLGSYVSELLAFPNGRHDDQVDSTSQALSWLTARTARAGHIVRRDIVRRDVRRLDESRPPTVHDDSNPDAFEE